MLEAIRTCGLYSREALTQSVFLAPQLCQLHLPRPGHRLGKSPERRQPVDRHVRRAFLRNPSAKRMAAATAR